MTITINGLPVVSGASLTFDLAVGETVFTVVVTGPDNTTVTYTVTITRAGTLAQDLYVKASNPDAGYFGASIAMHGDTLVVGANYEESNATGVVNGDGPSVAWPDGDHAGESGAVYVFVRNGATWIQQAYLKASNTDAYDNFGFSVAVWGDTIAVGAYQEDGGSTSTGQRDSNGDDDDSGGNDPGAVYVFTRSGSTWSQQAYLKGSNTGEGDYFGYSVALEEDTLVVGAPEEDSAPANQSNDDLSDSGAVYVFTRTGDEWSQRALLKGSEIAADDRFGTAVAVSGSTIAVGAPRDATDDGANAGAAYVFTGSGTTWTEQAYLVASKGFADAEFGKSLALSSDTLAVGSPGDPWPVSRPGTVYVFTRANSKWSEPVVIQASSPGDGDQFGDSVALSANTLVVGASREDSNASEIDGDQDDNSSDAAGAAYVFTRSDAEWTQLKYLKASNSGSSDRFGCAVGIWGDTIVAGSVGEDSDALGVGGNQSNNDNSQSGAVYIYQ